MLNLSFFITLAFCSFRLAAQLQGQALIDSLEVAAPRMQEDSNKVKTYSKISQLYYTINLLKTYEPAKKALAIAEKINWEKGIANLHNNLGLFISDTGNYELGNQHFRTSYAINKKLDLKINEINNLNNIGRNGMAVSDFTNAARYFFEALSIAESLKSDEHMALVGTNLISCFSRQKNYTKAMEYAQFTIVHAKLANNNRHLINGLMQLGTTQLELKDTTQAKTNLQEALKLCEKTENYVDRPKVLLNLATTEFPDYRKAIALMLQADTIVRQTAPGSGVDMNNNFNMADAYHKLARQTTGAEKAAYMQQATTRLAKAQTMAENTVPEMMAAVLLLQSDLQEEQGNYKAALASFKRSTAISDSLYSQDKKNELAGLEGKHNIAIKDKEITLNKLLLASQRKTQWELVAGLLLLAIIGGLLFAQSRARKRTNTALVTLNKQLDEANKVKARFFGILSHDLRSPIVNLVHFLELQKDNPELFTEEDKRLHQQEIGQSADNLLNTMEAMLLWSKEQMENFKPNLKPVEVEALFNYLHHFFGEPANIHLQFISAPGLQLMSDDNYLHIIMQNLTSNAIRALKDTDNAAIIWEAKKQGDEIVFSITDNGPGIAAAKANTLFEDSAVNNEKTGFGFHLIRDLAKAINYTITVHSEAGKGSTFILFKKVI